MGPLLLSASICHLVSGLNSQSTRCYKNSVICIEYSRTRDEPYSPVAKLGHLTSHPEHLSMRLANFPANHWPTTKAIVASFEKQLGQIILFVFAFRLFRVKLLLSYLKCYG